MPFTSTTKYEPINLKKEVYSLKDRIVDDLDLKNNVYDYLTIRSREILLEAIEKAKKVSITPTEEGCDSYKECDKCKLLIFKECVECDFCKLKIE